jgi:hypothetical protein
VSPARLQIVKRLQLRVGVLRGEFGKDLRFDQRNGRRGTVLAAQALLARRGELKSWVGADAMQLEVKARDTMGYAAYATSRSETCSNQQSSILHSPFSSASLADMTCEAIAGKAGEKVSDFTECCVCERTLRNL